jgi:hypothetical protein
MNPQERANEFIRRVATTPTPAAKLTEALERQPPRRDDEKRRKGAGKAASTRLADKVKRTGRSPQ